MKKYLLIILSFATLTACTEEIDLNLEVLAPKPVISGILSPIEQWVELSTSSAYLKDSSKYPISSATVSIVAEGVTYEMVERTEKKGFYQPVFDIPIVEGKEYKLTVQADFGGKGTIETFTSSCIVPQTPVLDSITITAMRTPGNDETLLFVMLFYQDFVGQDYYLTKTYVNDKVANALNSYGLQDNPRTDGIYVRNRIAAVLSKHPNSENPIGSGDVVRIDFSGITKEYYNFLYGAMEESSGRNPLFSGPPANIVGNISNGALGVFSVHTLNTRRVMLRF